MTAIYIGIIIGILCILTINSSKNFDNPLMYGLVLTGIGFIYVGFTWSNIPALLFCATQAVLFVFLAYYGIKKNLFILAAGYYLHGIWDLIYHVFPGSNLIPPHYDLFCMAADFTIGTYIIFAKIYFSDKMKI